MARLHYHRWHGNFVIDKFSSEDSMRDYLFSNPELIFEEDNAWVIPIKEEKFLRESADESGGRADIILCRIKKEEWKTVQERRTLRRSSIELWVVELKKEEASHENGFRQLFRYMTAIKNNAKVRDDLAGEIKNRVKVELSKKIEFEHEDNDGLEVYGSLIAPSFDLLSRTKEPIDDLKENLENMGKVAEGFTLVDAVDAARELFPVSLIKMIRFKRGDEEIIYSENILGQRAAAQMARIDPVDLFLKDKIKEDDVFYFRDNKDKHHEEVECNVLNRRGPSHSFMIKIVSIKGQDFIEVPKWSNDPEPHYEYMKKPIPTENTAKTCSAALHKFFRIYDDTELFKHYWDFGERHFVRKSDRKTLSDLKAEYRLSVE